MGLRIYASHKLLTKKNIRKFRKKLLKLCTRYDNGEEDYDKIYDFLEGWIAYAKQANTYKLRQKLFGSLEEKFAGEFSTKEYNRYLKTLSQHSATQ